MSVDTMPAHDATAAESGSTPVRLVTSVTTFDGTKAVSRRFEAQFEDDDSAEFAVVNLYPEIEYQRIDGFGGALTEATAHTLSLMSPRVQDEILESYFGKDGLGYTMVRLHLDSCDFALGTYEAVPTDDASLASFSLAHDELQIIPFLRRAQEIAGRDLEVMLTPWSPPAYMKTNNSRLRGGELKPEYRERWARYIARYVSEYRARGFNVTRITVQNEPNAAQKWDSCLFTAEQEKVFVRDFLHAAMSDAGLGDVGIYIWDHNKERLYERVRDIMDEQTAPLIAGAAFHWYTGDHFDALRLVREQYPDLDLSFTEGCVEYSRLGTDPQANAEIYGHDIIGNLGAGMNSYYDWNLVLDKEGGPNHVRNFCDAPVMCDIAAGTVDFKLSHHYLGHLSRAIRPGARRIASSTFSSRLELVAVRNPDGTVAVVAMNPTDEELSATVRIGGRTAPLALPARSMGSTIVTLR